MPQIEVCKRYKVRWGGQKDIDTAVIIGSGLETDMRQLKKNSSAASAPAPKAGKRKSDQRYSWK